MYIYYHLEALVSVIAFEIPIVFHSCVPLVLLLSGVYVCYHSKRTTHLKDN